MFRKLMAWLLSFFSKAERDDIYSIRERLIYSYWDGQQVRRVDPMALYRKLMDRGPELSIDIKLASSIHPDAPKGHVNLINRVREIFEVKTFDEGGLTELEAMQLFDHFLLFAHGIKKNSNPLPISSPEVSTPPSAEPQPTSNSSASGSTVVAPSTEPPVPSPTEQVSPSEPSPQTTTTSSP